MRYSYAICAAAIVVVGTTRSAHAAIISEGSDATLRYGYGLTAGGIDADTAHLWQMDETIPGGSPSASDTGNSATLIPFNGQTNTAVTTSVLQSPGGATNNARRIGTVANGTNGLHFFGSIQSNTTDNISVAQSNSTFGATGARTIDMLIRLNNITETANSQRLLTTENDEGVTNNITMDIIANVGGGMSVSYTQSGNASFGTALPTTGDDAPVVGGWYHYAVVYDGNEGTTNNTSVYWTRVNGVNDSTTAAHLLGTFTLDSDPTVVTGPTGTEFSFGHETNGSANKNFIGEIDFLRISTVARGAGEFIFVPEPAGLVLITIAGLGLATRTRCQRKYHSRI